jgi:hypothetical protein
VPAERQEQSAGKDEDAERDETAGSNRARHLVSHGGIVNGEGRLRQRLAATRALNSA